ncbi:MAG: ATP-binding cassette domain-containing protein [Acidimicrobiales bacterium]
MSGPRSGRAGEAAPGPRPGPLRSPLPFVGGLLLCYLAVPLVAFVVRLAGSNQRGFGEPGLLPALYISAACATISLAVISLLGLPLAYVLARSHGWVSRVVSWLVHLPLALPPVMGGIVVVYLVGPYTWLGRLFGGHLTESMAGVVLAQTFVAAPFLVVTARAAFATVDRSLLDVAATLGHGEVGRFARVALPAATEGIRAGMLLAWLRAFGEYGATVILAYHPFSLPVYTFNQFSAAGLPTTQAPTALALLAAGAAVAVSRVPFGSYRSLRMRRSGGPRALGWTVPAVAPPDAGPAGGFQRPAAPAAPAAPAMPLAFDVDHRQGDFHLVAAYRASGGRLAVLGPSGSGKSTLLGCLAGVRGDGPSEVVLGGRPLGHLPPARRGVGYVAQGFGLFPHLRVVDQVRFGIGAGDRSAAEWLSRLRLDGLEDRRPGELSGGQRQRVVLAQALATAPSLLLLDEPFSALDVPVRQELRHELRRLQRSSEIASIVVTHDPEEAALLADEIVVLSDGAVLQSGTVADVFRSPVCAEVARLLGIPNVQPAAVVRPGVLAIGGSDVAVPSAATPEAASVLWSIRPEHVRLLASRAPEAIGCRLVDVVDLGSVVEHEVVLDDGSALRVRTPDRLGLAVGERCSVVLPADAITVWPAAPAPAGRRIAAGSTKPGVRSGRGARRRRSSP